MYATTERHIARSHSYLYFGFDHLRSGILGAHWAPMWESACGNEKNPRRRLESAQAEDGQDEIARGSNPPSSNSGNASQKSCD